MMLPALIRADKAEQLIVVLEVRMIHWASLAITFNTLNRQRTEKLVMTALTQKKEKPFIYDGMGTFGSSTTLLRFL